ncbi:xanthine dehydrogenase family protein molybdopterin-binding subunit [Aquirufa echingensis]|uniref:Molybdopterin cofactor-binding domain-containing protein n=1 Tax=Aquirufa echingensis TaxID=3096516 RepID=A0ABW6D263_9BACT
MKTSTSRRDFLRISTTSAFVLALGFSSDSKGKLLKKVSTTGVQINPYININEAGKVTLFNPRPDMGQGTYQILPMLLAEELDIPLEQVEIQMTDGSDRFGSQLSGGSSSVRTRWIPLRTAGATVREMLVQAAANRWKISMNDCSTKDGFVINKLSQAKLSYGELVEEASHLPVPSKPKLKSFAEFTQLGKPSMRPDVPAKVDGTAIFGMDVQLPGMLYASIVHSPTIYGKVQSYDATKAMAVKGVRFVLKTERVFFHGPYSDSGGFDQKLRGKAEAIAVVSESYWSALKAKKLIQVSWNALGFGETATEQYFNQAKAAALHEGNEYKDAKVGDFAKALQLSDYKVQGTYQTPFMSHAPMEPCNATVFVQGDQVEVWAPIQGPDGLGNDLATYLGVKRENIKINVTFMGGAFGRKAVFDFVMQAANLSKQVNAPVKVIWTREDDIQQGPYRPGMISAMQGGLDKDGNVLAFEHRLNGASIMASVFKADMRNNPDPWAGEGINLEDSPYAFPARRNSFNWIDPQMPVLWWRSVYASTNVFAQESFMDELAAEGEKDPLDLRLHLLRDSPKFVAVLNKLAEISDYRAKRKQGVSIGIAIARSFASIVAHAVVVDKQKVGVKIKHVYSVIDCGFPLNPDNIKAQVESNIVYGLSAAVCNQITRTHGKTDQSNFHEYTVLRQGEIPASTIFVMPSQDEPGGVGEPGLPPIAPALCNAVFLATGKRVRTLPFDLSSI